VGLPLFPPAEAGGKKSPPEGGVPHIPLENAKPFFAQDRYIVHVGDKPPLNPPSVQGPKRSRVQETNSASAQHRSD
jgi:hypothetical protein